jgi:hypothetical protein
MDATTPSTRTTKVMTTVWLYLNRFALSMGASKIMSLPSMKDLMFSPKYSGRTCSAVSKLAMPHLQEEEGGGGGH